MEKERQELEKLDNPECKMDAKWGQPPFVKNKRGLGDAVFCLEIKSRTKK